MLTKPIRHLPYILFFILFCGADAFVYPYLNLYFSFRGLAGPQIGLINGLSYLVTILAGFLLGYLADKSGRPKLVLLFALLLTAASIWYLSIARVMLHLCLAGMLYTFFYVPGMDLGDKLVLDHLNRDVRLFGAFRFGGPLGYSIGVLAAGYLASAMGLISVLHVGILVIGLSILPVLLMRNPPRLDSPPAHAPWRQVATHHNALYYYGVMALWGFSESGALPYQSMYMADLGFSTDYTALLISIAMGGQMIGYLGLPLLMRRLRHEALVSAGFLMMAVRIGSFLIIRQTPVGLMLLLQFIGGLSQPLVLAVITQKIGESFQTEASSTAQTLKTVANRGIGGSVGVMLFGWLYGFLPPVTVMGLFCGLILAFALLTLLWGKHRRIHIV